MEFKRSTKQTRRPALNVPQRASTFPITQSPSQPPTAAPQPRLRKFLRAKPVIAGLIVLGCIVAVIVIRSVTGGGLNPVAQAPTYKTVLPKEKSVTELGGWKRVSPPGKEAVFAYADTLDGVPISVSQQPMPKVDIGEIAQKFNATNKIDAGGLAVYIGTSSKGPQSVILTKNNVLILIKSEKKIEDTSWAAYAQTLD